MRPTILSMQSHFAATVSALIVPYLILFLALSSPGFAYDPDLTSLAFENQSNLILETGGPQFSFPLGSYTGLEIDDVVDDDGKSRGLDLVRRVPSGVSSLGNNQYQLGVIEVGEVQWWYFPKATVNGEKSSVTSGLPASIPDGSDTDQNVSSNELRRRDGGGLSKRSATVYLSLTICSKPDLNTTNGHVPNPVPAFPQLDVYLSTTESLQEPGPGKDNSNQNVYSTEEGYMGISFEAQGDVFIGIAAPNTTNYSGIYKYQVAASIDALFHTVVNDTILHLVDSDINSALLMTDNLTYSSPDNENYQQWMNIVPPFTMFANNVNDTGISGLSQSYCALSLSAQIRKGDNGVEVGMTSRGLGNLPKEQIYIVGLNQSSNYTGILAMDGNSTSSGNGIIGGGGTVWQPMYFATKSNDNCAVLFNLTFCSEVAYAVPSNPQMTIDQLRLKYDNFSASLYNNFSYSLEQIQCNASNQSRYSLAVGCDDCATAYKQWLCGVTIPRCADFTNEASYLWPRNLGQPFPNGTTISASDPRLLDPSMNQSRNAMIDTAISPGPYKEILPCQDICFSLVKQCPSALGFQCPSGYWLQSSYGQRTSSDDITCSYLGAAYNLSAAWSLHASIAKTLFALGGFWAAFWFLDVVLNPV